MSNKNFDDSTVLDQSVENKKPTTIDGGKKETKPQKKGVWKKVAMGTGTGFVLGATGTILTGSALLEEEGPSDEEQTEGFTPLFDGEISMASGVNDNMSFADAFDAAREEVGPGGVFVWHGNIYSTFTPEEWENMSSEELNAYSDHFSWSPVNPEDPHVTFTSHTGGANDGEIPVATSVSDDMSFAEAFAAAREEVGPGGAFEWHGSVYHTYRDTDPEWNNMSQSERLEFSHQAIAAVHNQDDPGLCGMPNPMSDYDGPVVVETVHESEVQVEVIGVEHDYETGMNVGAVAIDGEAVILADVNGDGSFNLAWVDENGDGAVQENEVQDISGAGLTVNDLGGFDNPVFYAANMDSGADPDFTNDADVSGYMA